MRQFLRVLMAAALLLSCSAAAQALTVRDVIELTKAGVSEQVLLALIDVDHRVYTLDAASLKELKDAGVSEKVVIAMIRAGRTTPPSSDEKRQSEPPAPVSEPVQPDVTPVEQPQPVVGDRQDTAPQDAVAAVVMPFPVFLSPQRHQRGLALQGPLAPAARTTMRQPIPNYPLGTLAPQQPFVTMQQGGGAFVVPNYPLGSIAPQAPFLNATPITTPVCSTRLSAGGATTLVCR